MKGLRKFLRQVLVWWLPGLAMLAVLAGGFLFWLAGSQNGTRLLLTTARTHRLVACALFTLMQRRAERRHRLVRRELMRFETRLQGSLSFAGRPD